MKILITGGCGFLGSNLGFDALERGDALMVFDNLHRDGARKNLSWLREKKDFLFTEGDIRDPAAIAQAVRDFRPDAVFHLAGQVAMTTSIADPRLDFGINAMGSHNLLEAVRLHAPDAAVIYSSTNKVYGDLEQYDYAESETRYLCTDRPDGFDEHTPLDFHSPYGCSKGAADQYMLDYARIFNLNTVVFRHSSMYGGRQFSTFDQGWIGWFCRKAVDIRNGAAQEKFTISGTGKQVRDVLHAEDMKRLYRAAVARIGAARGQAFNIGGGIANSLSLLELFTLLEERLGIRMDFSRLPARESDQRVFVADIGKACAILGWEPQVSFRDGIDRMIDWTMTS